MCNTAAVFGLSGVGKNWLITHYAAGTRVQHIQASLLLRNAIAADSGRAVTSDELRTGAVLCNQQLLIEAFDRVRAASDRPLIFDGHCVVDNGTELIEIPVDVIGALCISGIVFIQDDASLILARRVNDKTRTRPVRSVKDIECHQQRAQLVCEAYARHLSVPLIVVNAGDEDRFSTALTWDLGTGEAHAAYAATAMP